MVYAAIGKRNKISKIIETYPEILQEKAALPEVPIIVDAACCAGVTPENQFFITDFPALCSFEINIQVCR